MDAKVCERRWCQRFVVKDDVFVTIRPSSTQVGWIKNVSQKGIAFEYAELREHGDNDEFRELGKDLAIDIFSPTVQLRTIRCRVVYNMITDAPSFIGMKTRRCGLEITRMDEGKRNQFLQFVEQQDMSDRQQY